MTDKECMRLEVKDRIASIILDSPPDNRMTRRFFDQLEYTIQKLEALEIGALLLYSGGRHFSAGADLEEIKNSIIEPYRNGKGLNKALELSVLKDCALLNKIETLPFPVIGAISGLCTGSGLELALACNIRICSKDCLMGSPEINWGLITGCNGSLRLERIIGRARALEFIIQGQLINSSTALTMGLANSVVEGKSLIPEAYKLAWLLAQKEREQINSFIKREIYYGNGGIS